MFITQTYVVQAAHVPLLIAPAIFHASSYLVNRRFGQI
jgi:hypothetical protein